MRAHASKSSRRMEAAAEGAVSARQSRFAKVYHLAPVERIALVKRGVPAADVARIAKSIGQPKERLMNLLGLPRATVDRKARAKQQLSVEHSERVIGFTNLVGQVEVMIAQSGDPIGFDAAKWLCEWLERPLPAFDGRRPAEFMDTTEGQHLVASLIAKMQSGAYA